MADFWKGLSIVDPSGEGGNYFLGMDRPDKRAIHSAWISVKYGSHGSSYFAPQALDASSFPSICLLAICGVAWYGATHRIEPDRFIALSSTRRDGKVI